MKEAVDKIETSINEEAEALIYADFPLSIG